MKRFRFVIAAVVSLWVGTATADSIPIFTIEGVNIAFFPLGGATDVGEMVFSLSGPGISIEGDGFFNCSGWCESFSYFPAGYPIDFSDLTTTFYTAQIRGKTYSDSSAFSSPWTLTSLGGDFTVPGGEVPAVLNNGLILGHVGSGNNLSTFYLKVPPGTLFVTFLQSDVDPTLFTWLPSGGFLAQSSVTPEPGTIILMVTGIVAIAALVRRRYRPGHADGLL